MRPGPDGEIHASGALTVAQLADLAFFTSLWMRYHPEVKLLTFRAPPHTTAERALAAFNSLSCAERLRCYQLPQHPMVQP